MIASKHYTPKTKGNKSAVWFITVLLSIIYFPYLKNFVVSVLLKLYELFVQHTIE